MVKNLVARTHNFLLLSLLLPFVYGCKGGGDSASAGSLFGNATSGLVGGGSGGAGGPGGGGEFTPTLSSLTAGLTPGGGGELASIHNPEPATILLLGTSMVAMGYFKNKKR